jgi:hypothetical protein
MELVNSLSNVIIYEIVYTSGIFCPPTELKEAQISEPGL